MALNVREALKTISENLQINLNYEIIPIEKSINRVCTDDIFAQYALPKFDNSAMDGYAIRYEDKNNELKIIDTIFAGDNKHTELKPNTCVKIMTGASSS
ncbi:MAG: hypothetical protein ACNI3H_07550 [Halarcobacter ebronensis]